MLQGAKSYAFSSLAWSHGPWPGHIHTAHCLLARGGHGFGHLLRVVKDQAQSRVDDGAAISVDVPSAPVSNFWIMGTLPIMDSPYFTRAVERLKQRPTFTAE